MKISSAEMGEILTLARCCKVSEFMEMLQALGCPLRVPTADLKHTIQTLRKIKQANARRGYRKKYKHEKKAA